MRPEVIAFRELDTLVRNLTDQLAGYRRRALSGEARSRELEQQLTTMQAALEGAQRAAADAVESREHALAAAREATANARQAQDALGQLERVVAVTAPTTTEVFPQVTAGESPGPGASDAVVLENTQLKARLAEARERTTQLAERVRFLRQQLMQGVDK